MKFSPLVFSTGILFSVLLSACSTSADIGHPVKPDMPAAFRQTEASGAAWDGPWWTSFGDPQLSALVEHAIVSNHDVRLALQRVKQARASEVRSDSTLWPTISANGNYINNKTGLPDAVKQSVPDIQSEGVGLGLSWEVDVFGGNRATARAAGHDATATEYEVAGAQLLTASEVARYYFVWRAAQDKRAVLEQLLKVQQQTQKHHEHRRDEGLEAALTSDNAQAETARIQAQLAPVRTLIVASEQHLATLLGTRDMSLLQVDTQAKQAPAWGNIPGIAAGQPSELLWRRPDLLAAESRLRAEGERVESALAQRWPKFFLSALIGSQNLSLNGVMNAPSRLSNILAAFAMPIFDAGGITASIDQQKSVRESAWLRYDQAALRALEEVETSLARLHNEQDDIDRATQQLAIRETNLRRADTMLSEGEMSQFSWLDMQRAELQSRLTVIDAREMRALAAVQLYQALGGGWRATGVAPAASTQHTHQS
ncbi:MAG: TolC family protein [Herbaspirillum sp.]|nr:TolC family protein [Herbaspirillum sp.]